MIEINKEYKYQDICNELGWNVAEGKTKVRQIKCIEESFEFYHPINKKTKKPKKSYIFTRIIREPILTDKRINNGGSRENAGKKSIFPEYEFNYIWEAFCYKGYKLNCYYDREWMNDIVFSNKVLYEEFGFDYYGIINRISYSKEKKYYFIEEKFKEIIMNILKSQTISKLCKRYGFENMKLPKSILRSINKNNPKELISQNDLLPIYNEWFKEELYEQGFEKEVEAIKAEKYWEIMDNVSKRFEKEKKVYNVKRWNCISVDDVDFKVVKDSFDKKILKQYQNHFRDIILDAVKKSVTKRIKDNGDKYNMILDDKAKELFQSYLSQLCDIACFVTSENIDNVNQDMLLEMDIIAALSEEENLIFDIV